MKTLCRYGLAALVLTAVLAPSARAVDPKHLPGDTEWVLTINLKQILDSKLVKDQNEGFKQARALIEAQMGEDVTKYLKDAGLDIFKDLHSITVASSGQKPEFTLIEGNFQVDKIVGVAEDLAKQNGEAVKISKAGKHKVFEIKGNETVFVSVISKKHLIGASTKEGLEEAIGRIAGDKESKLKKEFKTLLETTNDKQSISIAATGKGLAKMLEAAPKNLGNPAANQALGQLDGLSLAVTVAKDVKFEVGVNVKDEETAKQAVQMSGIFLKSLPLMMQKQAGQDPRLAPVMDILKTLRVTNQGSNLILSGHASVEVIEQLLKNLPNQ